MVTMPDILALYKHLHAEDAVAAQGIGHFAGYVVCFAQGAVAHVLRLPRVAVVAVDLDVTHRLAKLGACHIAHREHGDLVVEVDKSFYNHAAGSSASAFLGNVPSLVDVGLALDGALAMSR